MNQSRNQMKKGNLGKLKNDLISISNVLQTNTPSLVIETKPNFKGGRPVHGPLVVSMKLG